MPHAQQLHDDANRLRAKAADHHKVASNTVNRSLRYAQSDQNDQAQRMTIIAAKEESSASEMERQADEYEKQATELEAKAAEIQKERDALETEMKRRLDELDAKERALIESPPVLF